MLDDSLKLAKKQSVKMSSDAQLKQTHSNNNNNNRLIKLPSHEQNLHKSTSNSITTRLARTIEQLDKKRRQQQHYHPQHQHKENTIHFNNNENRFLRTRRLWVARRTKNQANISTLKKRRPRKRARGQTSDESKTKIEDIYTRIRAMLTHKSSRREFKKRYNSYTKSTRPDELRDNNNIKPQQQQQASMSGPLLLIIACLIPIQLATISCVNSLKVSVTIPELVKLNDAFWLNCTHQKQRENGGGYDEIYAIKWYKDDEEFYRYLPNAQPKVSIYETNGIQLDQTKSHEGSIFVNKADVNSEGNYRCEILSEAPLFETVRKSKHLKVYALPVRGPRIEILDANGKLKSPKAQEISYAVGDKIELRCNSAPSKPPARLRWYLNEHELTIPNANNNTSSSSRARRGISTNQPLAGYDVRVTPIEYRQHYKSIYSSHSTLSLVLQQDDLINNKISFKCLASMRHDVALKSKQLILLTPQPSTTTTTSSANYQDASSVVVDNNSAAEQGVLQQSSRSRRTPRAQTSASLAASTGGGVLSDLIADSEAHVHHRQRPQHQRHSISRLTHPQQQSKSQLQLKLSSDLINNNTLLASEASSLFKNQQPQMMYIYEDSHSTFGSSIIESVESLEKYISSLTTTSTGSSSLRRIANDSSNTNENVVYHSNTNANYIPEFNQADNLEYLQMLRDRATRQRSFPSQQSGGGSSHNLKRVHGANTLVKSPLYLDELDTLRPIISWPPLESGRLVLLPPTQTIVAIPTQLSSTVTRADSTLEQQQQQHPKYILPSRVDLELAGSSSSGTASRLPIAMESENQLKFIILLERLLQNLNCTCTDGAVDTRLGWFINDMPLEIRDTRLFPTRVSADHRQTWLTIGLQVAAANLWANTESSTSNRFIQTTPVNMHHSTSAPTSLQAIFAQFIRTSSFLSGRSSISGTGGSRTSPTTNSDPQQQQTTLMNNQIKFVCQTVHSMLLYSSSEMITFDFNPPPMTNGIDGNSLEKYPSSSNVIQATSASQSSSASGGNLIGLKNATLRSQNALITIFITFMCLYHNLFSHKETIHSN